MVRATWDYDQAKEEDFAEAKEKEVVELKAAGGKVAGRKQTRKPRTCRIETDTGEKADCQDQEPQANPLGEH